MIPNDLRAVIDLGWHVFPVSQYSKAACFKGAIDHATDHIPTVERWFREYPGCNWRAVPGLSGFFALDIDKPGDTHDADGFALAKRLVERYGVLPIGPRLKTGGSGGLVAFFRHDGCPLRGSGSLGAGIDILRGRVCPTIPPSKHQRTGNAYAWYPGYAPWETDLPDAPGWLLDLLKPPPPPPPVDYTQVDDDYVRANLERSMNYVRQASSGAANSCLNAASGVVGRLIGAGKISYSEAESALMSAAADRKIPPHEARATIRSGLNYGARQS